MDFRVSCLQFVGPRRLNSIEYQFLLEERQFGQNKAPEPREAAEGGRGRPACWK